MNSFLFATWHNQPTYYSLYHICGMLVAVAAGFIGGFLGKKYKYKDHKNIDRVMGYMGLLFVALEVFKEGFQAIVNHGYVWEFFPIQICSIAMYLLLCIPFLKKDSVKLSFLVVVSFFTFTAASFYYVKPAAAIVTPYIVISLHSFLWHSLLIGNAMFVMISYDLLKKENLKAMFHGYYIWCAIAFVAMMLNIICNHIAPNANIDFFYINPQNPAFYPLLNIFFDMPRPYPVYFVSFLIYYGLGCFLIYGLALGINSLVQKKAK